MTDLRSSGAALCLTQITSWDILYYAFPVLNPAITAATGWGTGTTTAAFSAALIVSALAGIYVGRILDHRGPRTVTTAGSVLGALSLLLVAAAPDPAVLLAGWLLAGTAMAATFYQPAFAALTRWWAPDHIRALTIVTLAGGLASTVFAPLTATLADHMSWRATYAVLAGILATVTIPAHTYALKAPWPPAPASPSHVTGGSDEVVRSRVFWMLAVTFTLSSFAMYAVVIGLVPLLIERGYTTTQAAWAFGLGGAGQTLGHRPRGPCPPPRRDRPHRHPDRTRRTDHRRPRQRGRPLRPSHRGVRPRRGWSGATSHSSRQPPSPTAGEPPTTADSPDSSAHPPTQQQPSPRSPAQSWLRRSAATPRSSPCSQRCRSSPPPQPSALTRACHGPA